MYEDEMFDKSVREAQIEGLKSLKHEVKTVEKIMINHGKFLFIVSQKTQAQKIIINLVKIPVKKEI